LFSIIIDKKESSEELNKDLVVIREWAYQWKVSSNPDQWKQAVEVYFTRKSAPASSRSITLPLLAVNIRNT